MSVLGFIILGAIFVVAIGIQGFLVAINNTRDAIPKDNSLKAIRRHAYNTAARRYSVIPVNPYAEGTWESDAWATEYRQALDVIQRDTRRAL